MNVALGLGQHLPNKHKSTKQYIHLKVQRLKADHCKTLPLTIVFSSLASRGATCPPPAWSCPSGWWSWSHPLLVALVSPPQHSWCLGPHQ